MMAPVSDTDLVILGGGYPGDPGYLGCGFQLDTKKMHFSQVVRGKGGDNRPGEEKFKFLAHDNHNT